MPGELLYGVPEPVLGVCVLAILAVAFELGFRAGRRARGRFDDDAKAQLSTMQTALLGLLALLLGFSFAMAESRFDARRQLILDESNAIGTTYLRSRLAPEPYRAALDRLFRQYVDARIAFYETPGVTADPARARAAGVETERLQRELWAQAGAAAAVDPRAITTGLLLQSLNEVIDLHEKRLVSLEAHVPEPILLVLIFVGATAFALLGLGSSLAGPRQLILTGVAALAVTSVALLVVDLDRPIRGQIRVSQQSMLRLRDSFNRPGP